MLQKLALAIQINIPSIEIIQAIDLYTFVLFLIYLYFSSVLNTYMKFINSDLNLKIDVIF